MHIIQPALISYEHFVSEGNDNQRLVMVLSELNVDKLIYNLDLERNGRRNKYPNRMLWNTLIAAKVYGIATVSNLVRELSRNPELREICGVLSVPKGYHYSRFISKLARPENQELLAQAFHVAVEELRGILPDLGKSIAIDGTAISSFHLSTYPLSSLQVPLPGGMGNVVSCILHPTSSLLFACLIKPA